jgi:hypothetical protein
MPGDSTTSTSSSTAAGWIDAGSTPARIARRVERRSVATASPSWRPSPIVRSLEDSLGSPRARRLAHSPP